MKKLLEAKGFEVTVAKDPRDPAPENAADFSRIGKIGMLYAKRSAKP